MKRTGRIKRGAQTLLILLLVLVVSGVINIVPRVRAAEITNTYLRETNMNAGGTSALRLVFKATQTSGTITINMNGADATHWVGTGSGAVTNGSYTVTTAACATETGFTALPGTLTVTAATPNIPIAGPTGLTVGVKYCADITGTPVTNPTAGEYHPTITMGADSTTVALRTVSSDTVVVNGAVPPTFNFALSGNTDNFSSNLATGSVVDTTGITATVNTNAFNGWYTWASDLGNGLKSTSQSYSLPSKSPGNASVQTLTAGTEGYLLGVTSIAQGTGAGVTSAPAGYSGASAASGDGLDTTNRVIAQSTGTAASAVITIKERAAISATTPAAADYTDTITFLASGNF